MGRGHISAFTLVQVDTKLATQNVSVLPCAPSAQRKRGSHEDHDSLRSLLQPRPSAGLLRLRRGLRGCALYPGRVVPWRGGCGEESQANPAPEVPRVWTPQPGGERREVVKAGYPKQTLHRCSFAKLCPDKLCFVKKAHLCYQQVGFFCSVIGKHVLIKRTRVKKGKKP